MTLMTQRNESRAADLGAIVIYQTQQGRSVLGVRLEYETLWLTLDQMAELFARDKSVISRHLRNVFPTGELARAAVVAKKGLFDVSSGFHDIGQRGRYQIDHGNEVRRISVSAST